MDAFFKYPAGQTYLNVNKEEFKKLLEDKEALKDRKLYLVDLRNDNEVAATGLIGHAGVKAIQIPISKFGDALKMSDEEFSNAYSVSKPDKERDVFVFSCAAGGRSAMASKAAVAEGYKNVANYTGGANDWF